MSESGKIGWSASVPIFRNTLILKQLALAVGIPFGIVALIIGLSGGGVYILYGLGLVAALIFFTWVFIMMVYRGRYEVEFELDRGGVRCKTKEGQAKKNRVINFLTVVLGLLSGKPAVSGAGMLAASRQDTAISWNRITKVKYKPASRTILVRGGFAESIALFCTDCNYPEIERIVRQRTDRPS